MMKYWILLLSMLSLVACEAVKKPLDAEKKAYDQEVEVLLSKMTLDEKIGQMVLYTSHWDVTGPVVSNDNERYIREGLCGNIFNAHEVSFNRKLQEIAVNETRLGIPLLFGYDVVHGYRTSFPIPLAEASSWDTLLMEKTARIAAIEASACGVNWTFAPMVDISFDPRWGRVAEGSGEDPFLGSAIARARVRGFQGTDLSDSTTILACVKHFAAYGAPEAGRDYNTVDMSDRMLREVYLPPYKAAIDAGAASVMTAFNEIDGIPASGNRYLLHDILREEWGFKGFVVTDYTAVEEMIPHGVASNEYEAAKLAINAGVDMDMESSSFREHLKELVDNGQVSEATIDDAVRNVLHAKFKLGLFEDPYRYLDESRQNSELESPWSLDAAYESAIKSMVLLKNQSHVLPLKKGTKIALIGPHTNLQRDLLGSWIADGKWDNIQTIKEAMEEMNGVENTAYSKGCWFDEEDRSAFKEALSLAGKSDVIVLFMGESWHWSGEAASRTRITLPSPQSELIEKLSALDKPIVLVLLNGRPLALENEEKHVDAILEAWFPGTMGAKAIADLLFGNKNPSGKLPMTFPRNLGQVPIHYMVKNTGRPYITDGPEQKYRSRYIDSPNTPLFPFGYGLSYTSFDYSDITISGENLKPGEEIEVSVLLKNTGSIAGEETVQLYIRDLVGSVTRPLKELKDFRKVYLEPGQEQRVSFTISPHMLRFFRADMSFGTEPGLFTVFIGGNSRDCLEINFELYSS